MRREGDGRPALASGFENVILMDGGIEEWIREGFKTVLPATSPAGPGPSRRGRDRPDARDARARRPSPARGRAVTAAGPAARLTRRPQTRPSLPRRDESAKQRADEENVQRLRRFA